MTLIITKKAKNMKIFFANEICELGSVKISETSFQWQHSLLILLLFQITIISAKIYSGLKFICPLFTFLDSSLLEIS